MRELYLKAFAIAVETPVMEIKYLNDDREAQSRTIRATTGIMSSFNRIGGAWTGGSKSLLTNVLRDEWAYPMKADSRSSTGNTLDLCGVSNEANSPYFTAFPVSGRKSAKRQSVWRNGGEYEFFIRTDSLKKPSVFLSADI